MAAATSSFESRSPKLPPLVAVVALPFALFVAHGWFFSDWLIDDAGISFAYARNLAAGHGLVAQPGDAPVEGFTNLLWVLMLAPIARFGESPGTAARLLSHGLVLASFLLLAQGAGTWFPRRSLPITAIGLSTTALITGFPAWTLSGLENGLLAALLAALVVAATRLPDAPRSGVGIGCLWILLFATRPDTAPLALVPAVALALRSHRRSRTPYAATVGAGLFGLTAFRALYFGDAFPTTYYAKGAIASELTGAVSWTGTLGLLFALAGGLALGGAAALAGWAVHRRFRLAELSEAGNGRVVLWLTLLISWASFEALPTDWMGEGRFATPIFLLGPLALLGLMRTRFLFAATATALVLAAGGYALQRTPMFARNPPAPFSSVIEISDRLAAVGEVLGTGSRTKILLPDIGGALWADRFQVIDLGGLTDPRIARTLHSEDRRAFYDEVFERRRPDLIWIHGYWRELARLEAEPRLSGDYELLLEGGGHALYVRSETARGVDREALRSPFVG